MSPTDVVVRRAGPEHFSTAAALRWRWVGEMGTQVGDPDEFAVAFANWARYHAQTHALFLAFLDSEAVGMTWVALAPRVPSPGALDRFNADLQSVYVVPEARGLGAGSALVEAALAWATEAGAELATVHSSRQGISMYQRAGLVGAAAWLDKNLR